MIDVYDNVKGMSTLCKIRYMKNIYGTRRILNVGGGKIALSDTPNRVRKVCCGRREILYGPGIFVEIASGIFLTLIFVKVLRVRLKLLQSVST